MSFENPKRVEKYLSKVYGEYPLQKQQTLLIEIINRLNKKGLLTKEMLEEMKSVLKTNTTEIGKVIAKYSMLDIDDRV